MTSQFCWKCHKKYPDRINFKSVCDSCGTYLHACLGCQYHQPGRNNQCQIPGTEPVRDREHFNYCEEFKAISDVSKSNQPSVEDIAKRLFKDD